jgi:hypothetical protein
MPKSSYRSFFKSVGHDDEDCRMLELMRERTSDNYGVQEKMMAGKDAPQFIQVPQPYNNAQPQYNNVQPDYNPAHYNQVSQYNTS